MGLDAAELARSLLLLDAVDPREALEVLGHHPEQDERMRVQKYGCSAQPRGRRKVQLQSLVCTTEEAAIEELPLDVAAHDSKRGLAIFGEDGHGAADGADWVAESYTC